jgi:hypothetical protein
MVVDVALNQQLGAWHGPTVLVLYDLFRLNRLKALFHFAG